MESLLYSDGSVTWISDVSIEYYFCENPFLLFIIVLYLYLINGILFSNNSQLVSMKSLECLNGWHQLPMWKSLTGNVMYFATIVKDVLLNFRLLPCLYLFHNVITCLWRVCLTIICSHALCSYFHISCM